MKNKNSWFSPKLYVESLRRLRLVGFVSLILLSIANVLIAIGFSDYGFDTIPMRSAIEANGPILAVIYVAVPLMMLIVFSFLNQRNGSDFFASAPVKRECLYFSTMAAVLSWCAVLILGGSAVSLLCSAIFSNYYTVNLLSFWVLMFNVFAGCVFVAGVFAIAVSITGTVFTNIMIALLIAIMPRVLIAMIGSSAQYIYFVLDSSQVVSQPWYLDGSLNTATWPIQLIFDNGSTDSLLNPSAGIYTLCVGVVYIALGALLFHFRKSETAGRSAPNRTMQAVYRLSIALLITLPCCEMIFSNRIFNEGGDEFFCLVLYIIAAAAYFIYELITTKKAKNLLRAAPGLLILVVLNVAVIGGKQIVYQSELNFQPDAGEITSISIVPRQSYYYDEDNWFSTQVSDLEIRDEEINKIVARSLKQQVQAWKEYGKSYYSEYKYINMLTDGNPDGTINEQSIVIRCGGRTKGRIVYMSEADWQAFTDRLEANDLFQAAYQALPSADDAGVSLSCSFAIEDDALRRVYETMREEIASLDFTDWYTFIKSGYADDISLCDITVTAPFRTESTVTAFELYPSVLPKTCAQLMEENLAMQPTFIEEIERFCENIEEADKSFEIMYYSPSDADTYSHYYASVWEENCDALLELMQEIQGTAVQPGDAYFTVSYYDFSNYNPYASYYRGADEYRVFFPLKTEEQLKQMEEILYAVDAYR